jgi:hypothetical protein
MEGPRAARRRSRSVHARASLHGRSASPRPSRCGTRARTTLSIGGRKPGEGVWDTFLATVREHSPALRELVSQPVQTNEVARSAALLGGFLTLALETGLPLRLLEIGSSAGLNLRWDHYRYETPHGSWGDAGSPVRLRGFLAGGRLPLESGVRIVERRGCDVVPLNPNTEEGRLSMLSFVWPDQVDRIERLRHALLVAKALPAIVDREEAGPWLEERFHRTPGCATVIFHSIVWQYLGGEGQQRVPSVQPSRQGARRRSHTHQWLGSA